MIIKITIIIINNNNKHSQMKENNNPIQDSIDNLLLPTLFGQTEPLPSGLRQFVTLTSAQGGLGVPDLQFEAPQQLAASMSITPLHEDSVTTQSMFMVAGENSTEELKRTSNLEICVGEIENGKY